MAHSGHKETHAWGRHKARERYKADGGPIDENGHLYGSPTGDTSAGSKAQDRGKNDDAFNQAVKGLTNG